MAAAAANDDAVCPDGNDDVDGVSTISCRSRTSNGLGRSTMGFRIRSVTI